MVDLEGRLRLHDGMTHRTAFIGAERAPVLVVDNFLFDPDVMVAYASEQSAFGPGDAYYPGIRAPIPPIYSFALRAFLGDLIRTAFSLGASDVVREKCDFSLVTTRPENLAPLQRLPHIDNTDPKHFAVLHYLCDKRHGGTAFYRHRATGFEIVDQARFAAYKAAVEQELATQPPAARYAGGDDTNYERIASFDAAFNRVLVYRGFGLHSADIPADFAFDPNPRTGRLTANAFFYFR